ATSTATSAGEPSRVVELLSLPSPCLPICSTNLPSMVNLRSWPSFLPLPASQTKSLPSMKIPCSLCGNGKPSPGPPQWRSRLPDWSNTSTGGAAAQHLASGWVLLGRTLAWRKRGRPVHDPDAVISVGGDAGDLPQNPF